ncbi:MAG: AAA family ATPase [Lachnospiraceae bacterium]|nr:AAA family ATPase [Lachnospiraceae bacterium]
MEDSQIFLDKVTQCLKVRIEELDRTLLEGQADVERMHDYYWENYSEMDEYGYENFDNQQALLTQINANTEAIKLRDRFKKMLSNPYFGRVDFRYDDEDEAETFYIGIGNFARRSGALPLIYDWRAPVSGLFYDYDKGPASYTAPGGEMTGEVTAKWQYKIRHGKLIYAFESDTKIDDEVLREELGKKGDTALKNLVQTIQREQNAIIRNTKDRILLIQGVAGSGKTSVALHRIAYLLYHDREHLKANQVLILSPNGVFTDYISHILPELGEENIREMSFDTFAYRELSRWIDDCEEHYDAIERQLAGEEIGEDTLYKMSELLPEDLDNYALELEDTLLTFAPIRIRGVTMGVKEIMTLFHQKFNTIPLLKRLDAVFDYAVDAFETLSGKTLPEEEVAELREKAHQMYRTEDIYILYSEFLDMLGFDDLPHVWKDRRVIRYEDVYPMLYLKYKLLGRGEHKKIRHLIIDEMQDYSFLQYKLLAMLFHCPMTILGDKAQTMEAEEADVTTFLPAILGEDVKLITMNKSYRSTLEIGQYAAALRENGFTDAADNPRHKGSDPGRPGAHKPQDIEFFERHGEAVTITDYTDVQAAAEAIAKTYAAGRADIETAAVITFTEKEARCLYDTLSGLFSEIGLNPDQELTLIHKNSGRFRPGLTVTTFYLAKGLEFDDVYSVEPSSKVTPLHIQARYIAATRAMHRLNVLRIDA